MKLKAPEGVGDPCVAGVMIASCGGVYDVEGEVAGLLMECFGFIEIEAKAAEVASPESVPKPASKSAPKPVPAARRGKPAARKA
jgi:hypothetical protein